MLHTILSHVFKVSAIKEMLRILVSNRRAVIPDDILALSITFCNVSISFRLQRSVNPDGNTYREAMLVQSFHAIRTDLVLWASRKENTLSHNSFGSLGGAMILSVVDASKEDALSEC